MSIETLLEAAKYLEYRSEVKARGEVPKDYSSYVSCGAAGNRSYNLVFQPSYTVENERGRSSEESKSEKRRTGGSGTREVHNKLEKNRRAHLKKCFETLKRQIPNMDEKKTSNLWILRSALRYIQTLKRKERECEYEMERLTREKSFLLRKFGNLKKDSPLSLDQSDVGSILQDDANDTNSTSTATECGPQSDVEDEKIGDEACTKSPDDSSNGTCTAVCKPELPRNERETPSPNHLNKVATPNCFKVATTVVASPSSETSVIKESGFSSLTKVTSTDIVTSTTSDTNGVKLESSGSSNLRIGRPPQVHVGSFTFPAQVMPHIGLNGNGGLLTHSTLQLVTPPTVRVLTPSGVSARSFTVSSVTNSNQPSSLQSGASSATVAVQSNSPATVHMVKTAPSVARMLQQPSTVSPPSSATIVKGLIASGGPTSSPIAIAQLTVKPNNSLSNLVHQPIFTAATVNFHTVGTAVTSSSSSSTVSSVAGQIVTTNIKPGAQIAQVMTPSTMHVSSVGQMITAGSSLSSGAPLVSVVPSINHATVTQVLGPTQLGKVLSSPLIKSVGQIPIIQQQFLPHLGTVSGQPIVMVTTQPSTVSSSTTTTQQAEKVNLPV